MYILYGEEAYLRNQYKGKLKTALLDGGDAMNLQCFEGKDVKTGDVIDLAETMPFLAQRRVIVLENSGLFAHGGEELAHYLESPSETVYFVFAEDGGRFWVYCYCIDPVLHQSQYRLRHGGESII